MALTDTRPDEAAVADDSEATPAPSRLEQLVGTGDHLTIGRLLVGFSLVLGAVSAAGLTAAGLDGVTDDGLLGVSAGLWTASLVGLVVLGVVPLLLGLAVVVVPRQVGSPSVAFPRAAAAGLWTWLVAALVYLVGVAMDGGIGGADTDGARMTSLGLGGVLVALGLLSSCVATTVLSHRPLGMKLARVPFFSWSMLLAAPVWIMSFGSSVAHIFVGQISGADADGLTVVFDTGVAWMFRLPSAYMLAIPVLGIAADVVAMTAGRRIRTYGLLQGLIGAYAVVSFGAWSQTPGSQQTIIWVLAVLAAAVPVLGTVALLGEVLRHGSLRATPALIGSLLAPLLILGGVLAGAVQGLDTAGSGQLWNLATTQLEGAQTVFLFGAAALGAFAGLAHWSRRTVDAPQPSGPANGAIAAVLVGAGLIATLHLVQGIAAGDGRGGIASEAFSGIVATGAVLVLLGFLGALAAVVGAARAGGEEADADDEAGMTLEWAPPGPVVAGQVPDWDPVTSPYPLADLRDGDEETR